MIDAIRELAEMLADLNTNHVFQGSSTYSIETTQMRECVAQEQPYYAKRQLMKNIADAAIRDCQVDQPRIVMLDGQNSDGPHGPVHQLRARVCVVHPEKLRRMEELVIQLLRYEEHMQTARVVL